MNIVFWFIVILLAAILWVTISFIFVPFGTFIYKILKRTSDNLQSDGEEKTETKKEEKGEN